MLGSCMDVFFPNFQFIGDSQFLTGAVFAIVGFILGTVIASIVFKPRRN